MIPAASPTSVRNRLSGWLKDELRPSQFIASLNAALVLYLLEIIVTLSLAALIFSGRLAPQLPYAVSFILIGSALLITVVTTLSSYGGSLAATQDAPGVILALAARAAAVSAAETADTLFATVIVLIVGSTLAMGLLYVLLGFFKLGGLARFLPYPVMGGFLAGTGWLLTIGGISITTQVPLGPDLLQPGILARWLPALVLGFVLLLALRRWKSPLALAALVVFALLMFYGLIWFLGISLSTLTAEGWLIGPFPQGLVWRFPLDAHILVHVNGQALLNSIPIAAPALLISMFGLLLNASGLELVVKRDVALNRELIVAGVANLVSGLGGGLIGYHAISLSTLNHTLRGGRRLPGLLVAGLLILTVVVGTAVLSLIPRLLLGSLLVYIGLELLNEWVIRSWFRVPRLDYAIILAILVMIALTNFLWGIGLGMIVTILLFVVSYSRIDIVRYELTGATYRSRVNRSLRQWELLQTSGDQLLIFKLHGFIFFGTANSLFERVREHTRRASAVPVRFILLDFEQVSGMDSTGLLSFHKLLLFARESAIDLIFTGLAGRTRSQLLQGGFSEQTETLRLFADLDRGVEWCEDQIVASVQPAIALDTNLRDQLLSIVPDESRIDALIQRLRRRDVAVGEQIIRQGDQPDVLFFLEAGQLTAQLEKPGREPVRLEIMQGGCMVGELGFFLGTPRNASVVAERPSVVYILTREAWDQITAHDPEVAQTLNRLAIYLLGQRVAHLTRVVNALQY